MSNVFQSTEDFKNKLITLLRSGKTNVEIGKIYKVSKKTIPVWFKKLGISSIKYRSKLKSGDEERIIEMYKQGITTKDIAKSFSVSVHTLETFQKKYKIKARDYFESRHNYNIHVFDKIDTEEKAYWLGFLYADGCVDSSRNRIHLELKNVDRNHVIKFKNFLADTRDDSIIKTVCAKLPSGNTYHARYSISSSTIKNDLIKHGCVPRKSLILKFPDESSFESSDLVFDFIRGYIDGDGCLRKAGKFSIAIEILGTEDFLKGIIRYFPEFKKATRVRHTKVFRTACFGKNSKKVANKLYGHATIYLDRKFEKFTALFKDSETLGNIGEGCDANTETTNEISKGSLAS